jgi:hypothetical protein
MEPSGIGLEHSETGLEGSKTAKKPAFRRVRGKTL